MPPRHSNVSRSFKAWQESQGASLSAPRASSADTTPEVSPDIRYPPIEDLNLIGNSITAALVSPHEGQVRLVPAVRGGGVDCG